MADTGNRANQRTLKTLERAFSKAGAGGTRVSGLRARVPRPKLIAAAVVAVVAVAGLIGGLSGDASAEPTVQAFLLAWGQGQYRTAAGMTTGDPARSGKRR